MTERGVRGWTIGAFMASLAIACVLIVLSASLQVRQRREDALNATINYGGRITDSLEHSLAMTYALAAVIEHADGKITSFDRLAKSILSGSSTPCSLELVPNGTITEAYPYERNRRAIGLNLFSDPSRREEAIRARDTKKLTLTGPFEFYQGGVGLAGRLPVFLPDGKGQSKFWGFSEVVIFVDDLLNSSNTDGLLKQGFEYQLWLIRPKDGSLQVFGRSTSKFMPDAVTYSFEVPNGTWNLSVRPRTGWWSRPMVFSESLVGLVFSIMVALLVRSLLYRPLLMSKEVAERTRELQSANERLAEEALTRANAQLALQESERQFRTIYEGAPFGITNVDSTGRFIRANPAFLKLIGYDEEELRQKTFFDVTLLDGEAPRDPGTHIIDSMVAGTLDFADIRKIYIRKDGSTFLVRVAVTAVRDANGKFLNTISITEDITERTNLEARLTQSQKMEAIGTLAGGIAHDFNNILSAIKGHVDVLLEELPPDMACRDSAVQIGRSSARAAELVSQILTFGRKDENERRPLLIKPLVEDSVRLLKATLPTSIDVTLTFESDALAVKTNPTEIHRLLMNLASNADAAMRGRTGRLDIVVRPVLAREESQPDDSDSSKEFAEIVVTDTGTGIESHAIDRAFEPFFTTKEAGQGTGLGLAIVHGIMTSAGGSVSIESEVGKGTTVRLLFPTCEFVETAPEPTAHRVQGHSEHILFIDDEEDLVFLARRFLERSGYRFTGFSNPVQAVEAFLADPKKFDLVCCDITMPGMLGLDVAARIKSVAPTTPIVLMSGYVRQEDIDRCAELGVSELVLKPNSITMIPEVIHRVLENHGRPTA
jgi:PAS domain S-box-containing protein